MRFHTTRLAILAAALLALPACSDSTGPAAPRSSNVSPIAARQPGGALTAPVTGTVTGTSQVFNGTFAISRFAVQNGQLVAIGTLAGVITDAGALVGNVNQQATLPVTQATGSCTILHLELGPLDLNLLGLMVHLDRVVLDITAQQGPGNLLGNLLCAIANLLNGGLNLNGLAQLLNQLLAILG